MKPLILVIITICIILSGCGSPKDPNYLGYIQQLPKGEYVIYNHGSRHIVRCVKPNGEYYLLNDNSFKRNGIPGHDAHQYRNKTKIIIK